MKRVVHEDGITPARQLVRWGAARVVHVTKPDCAPAGVGTEVDQLLSPNGADAAMTVHAEYTWKVALHACWAQQPRARVRPIANRPTQSTDHDAI
jgi:hypothetical protein